MRWRPLLCAAAAAVAVGAFYYFYTCRNRHERTREVPEVETVNKASTSPLQPASRPPLNANQGAPEAAGDTDAQSPHIPFPRVPSVASSPSQPQFKPQKESPAPTESVFGRHVEILQLPRAHPHHHSRLLLHLSHHLSLSQS
ncbi:hypothetical protein SRHO_G00206110 [Serrasalmus rhombeus]